MKEYRAIFNADEKSIRALTMHWPELTIEACEDENTFWVGGTPLDLGGCFGNFRLGLKQFSEHANCLIALIDADLSSVSSLGCLEVIEGETRHRICLVESARLEFVGQPIVLEARGTTRPIRPMAQRAIELLAREERFCHATTIFAACGEDMRELFKVAELIEIAHGRMPKKTKPIERENFFKTIEVAADDWEALQRSFRPKRHAEPHDMVGRTISPRLARILIQHALKLWLAREVPA